MERQNDQSWAYSLILEGRLLLDRLKTRQIQSPMQMDQVRRTQKPALVTKINKETRRFRSCPHGVWWLSLCLFTAPHVGVA